GAEVLAQPVHVDLGGEGRGLLTSFDGRGDVAEVAHPAHAQHPGALVEDVVDLRGAQPGTAMQVEVDRGVDVPGAGAHHQTFERGQAHGGLHRPVAEHGGGRGPVAQVHDDLAQPGDVAALRGQQAGDLPGDVLVAGAVGAVAPHLVLGGDLTVQRVVRRGLG